MPKITLLADNQKYLQFSGELLPIQASGASGDDPTCQFTLTDTGSVSGGVDLVRLMASNGKYLTRTSIFSDHFLQASCSPPTKPGDPVDPATLLKMTNVGSEQATFQASDSGTAPFFYCSRVSIGDQITANKSVSDVFCNFTVAYVDES